MTAEERISERRDTAVEEEEEAEVEREREEEEEEIQASPTRLGPHCLTVFNGMLGGSLRALIIT